MIGLHLDKYIDSVSETHHILFKSLVLKINSQREKSVG